MVTIRKATIKDLEVVQDLYKRLHEFEDTFTDEFDKDWAYSEKGKKFFASRLRSYNTIGLISEDDGRPMGFSLTYISSAKMRFRDKIALLEYLYVEEDMRGKGVGSKLLKSTKKILKEKQIKMLKVVSLSSNIDAINFYKRNGFGEFALILE